MAWTDKQRTLFMIAARAAGWNTDQRYIAMRHCGCPLTAGAPSVNHPRNDHTAFERCMALAESCAGQRGERIQPPRGKRSWREAEASQGDRLRRLAMAIVTEAVDLLPTHFDARLLDHTIQHICGRDAVWTVRSDGPIRLESLDAGQLYRVVEGLKARIGRMLLERGITPRSFTVPASARRRVKVGAA